MKKKDKVKRKLVRVQRMLEQMVADPPPWEAWMDTFLEDLERLGTASAAIELSGKCRGTVYKYRRRNEEFKRRWLQIRARKS